MSNYWDDPAKDFRQRYALPYHFMWDRNVLMAVDQTSYMDIALSLLPKPPCEVLDAGCGDGWMSLKLAERGYRVSGIDYSERAVRFAGILVPQAEFRVQDMRSIGAVEDFHARFDAITCIEVLEHIPPQYYPETFAGLKRSLKKGGSLVISVPSTNLAITPADYKHFDYDECPLLLKQAGFEVEMTICQHVINWISNDKVWRIVNNKFIDFKFLRAILANLFQRYANITTDPKKAGRYIYLAKTD